MALGNEFVDSGNFGTGEGERFWLQCVSWLAKRVSGIEVNRYSGVTPAGGSSAVALNVLPSGLDWGLYEAMFTVTSNDPASHLVTVPVRLFIEDPSVLASRYQAWQFLQSGNLGVGTAFAEDWDGNGVSNGFEYFFAFDIRGSSSLPVLSRSSEGLRLSYTQRSNLPSEWLEWMSSEDLEVWTPMLERLDLSDYPSQENGDGTHNVELPLEGDAESRFFNYSLSNP